MCIDMVIADKSVQAKSRQHVCIMYTTQMTKSEQSSVVLKEPPPYIFIVYSFCPLFCVCTTFTIYIDLVLHHSIGARDADGPNVT